MTDDRYNLILGNAADALRGIGSETVDCCVTSPPYYNLRDYGTGSWIGGDPNCNHIANPAATKKQGNPDFNENRPSRDKTITAGRYKPICPKCGAVRNDEQIGLEQSPEDYINKLVEVFDEQVDERYYFSLTETEKIVIETSNAVMETKTANKCIKVGTLVGGRWDKYLKMSRRVYSAYGVSPTLVVFSECAPKVYEINIRDGQRLIRVRKYTERECFRLMGVKDEDFDRIAPNQSRSGLYHLTGDSIITTCMMAIFGEMLGIDYEKKIKELQRSITNDPK